MTDSTKAPLPVHAWQLTAAALYFCRRAAGLTVRQFADMTEFSRSQWCRLENNGIPPDSETAASAFEVLRDKVPFESRAEVEKRIRSVVDANFQVTTVSDTVTQDLTGSARWGRSSTALRKAADLLLIQISPSTAEVRDVP